MKTEMELYAGREQSYIKHFVLDSYLEKLFMIIGRHESRICYVDCFSGPWKAADKSLSDTSIARSIKVMKKCRDGLEKSFGRSVDFRALFIEKSSRSYKLLDSYLKENPVEGVEAQALKGKFHLLTDEILKWCGSKDFVFFFIDPTGWKNAIEIPILKPLLKRRRSEFLINFMYDFILRIHTQEYFTQDMPAIFGEVPESTGMDPKQRDTFLIRKYRENLKNFPAHPNETLRTAHVRILDPLKDRTKFHLVYLTRHPMGIIKFMEASEKAGEVQKRVRMETKLDKRKKDTGMDDLFGNSIESEDSQDETVGIDEVKAHWLSFLPLTVTHFGNEELANMLEETDWFESDLQSAFNELLKEEKVQNLDMRNPRPKRPVHFEDKDRLRKIE